MTSRYSEATGYGRNLDLLIMSQVFRVFCFVFFFFWRQKANIANAKMKKTKKSIPCFISYKKWAHRETYPNATTLSLMYSFPTLIHYTIRLPYANLVTLHSAAFDCSMDCHTSNNGFNNLFAKAWSCLATSTHEYVFLVCLLAKFLSTRSQVLVYQQAKTNLAFDIGVFGLPLFGVKLLTILLYLHTRHSRVLHACTR